MVFGVLCDFGVMGAGAGVVDVGAGAGVVGVVVVSRSILSMTTSLMNETGKSSNCTISVKSAARFSFESGLTRSHIRNS